MMMHKSGLKDGTGKDGKEPEWETVDEMETLNSMVPLWHKRKMK